MDRVWVLKKYGDPDPEVFRNFDLALTQYHEYIEERTSGMDWNDEEFEWHDYTYNKNKNLRSLSCYCYGEFVAELHEVELQ